jgi:cytochrome P450
VTERREELMHDLFDRHREISPERRAECLAALAALGQPHYDAERGRWLLTDLDQVSRVLRDGRLSNDLGRARPTTRSRQLSTRLGRAAPPVLFLDPPLHTKVRHALMDRFAAQRMTLAEPRLRRIAAELVGAVGRERFDLGAGLTQPMAARALWDLLGFRPATATRELVDDLFAVNQLLDMSADEDMVRRSRAASTRVRQLIVAELGAGSLGETFAAADVPEDLAVASVEFTMRAGIITSSCLYANALATLAGDRVTPVSLDAEAVERMIVAASPAYETGRVTVADTPVGEVTIPAGSTVISLLPSANLPLLDGPGPVAGRHVSFGAGRHFCVGAALTRLSLVALLHAVFAEHRLTVHDITDRHTTAAFCGIRHATASLTPVGS